MGRWSAWKETAADRPQEAFYGSFFIGGCGLFLIVMGGLVGVGGFHVQSDPNDGPSYALGDVIMVVGLAFVLLGAVHALLNLWFWASARRRGK